MLKEYKLQTILGIWGGLFFMLLGYFMASHRTTSIVFFGHAALIGGVALFVSGCFMYAKGKGYPWLMGLLCLLGPVGLLLLYALKDHGNLILKQRERENR